MSSFLPHVDKSPFTLVSICLLYIFIYAETPQPVLGRHVFSSKPHIQLFFLFINELLQF